MSALRLFRSLRLKLRQFEHIKDRCGPLANTLVDESPVIDLKAPILYQRNRIAGSHQSSGR